MFEKLLSAATRVAITPITLAVDVVKFIPDSMDNGPKREYPLSRTTSNLAKAIEDVEDAVDGR